MFVKRACEWCRWFKGLSSWRRGGGEGEREGFLVPTAAITVLRLPLPPPAPRRNSGVYVSYSVRDPRLSILRQPTFASSSSSSSSTRVARGIRASLRDSPSPLPPRAAGMFPRRTVFLHVFHARVSLRPTFVVDSARRQIIARCLASGFSRLPTPVAPRSWSQHLAQLQVMSFVAHGASREYLTSRPSPVAAPARRCGKRSFMQRSASSELFAAVREDAKRPMTTIHRSLGGDPAEKVEGRVLPGMGAAHAPLPCLRYRSVAISIYINHRTRNEVRRNRITGG